MRLPSSQRTWTRLYDYTWANDRYYKVFFLLGVYKESAHRIVQSITASLNESNKTLGLEFVVFYTSHSSNLHVKRCFVFWLSFEVTSHFMSSLQQQQLKLLLVKHCGVFLHFVFLNCCPISFKELFWIKCLICIIQSRITLTQKSEAFMWLLWFLLKKKLEREKFLKVAKWTRVHGDRKSAPHSKALKTHSSLNQSNWT